MPYTEQYSTLFLQRLMEVLFRETLDVHPLPWKEIVAQASVIPCGRYKDGVELNMSVLMHKFAQKHKDPNNMHKLVMEDSAKVLSATSVQLNDLLINPVGSFEQPGEGVAVLRRSWFGVHLRKIRLGYMKLSEAGVQRLMKAYASWVDGESMDDYEFGPEVVSLPGFMLIPTTSDHANPSTTDAYELFERDQHIGNLPGAVDNLRQYFDQRFTQGRQPPRQHALNALAHYYVGAGEVESARQGESLTFLFQKRFEAVGALDLPPDMQIWPLETQWQIWAIDAQLWRLAGMASVAEITDKIVLANTSPKDDVRLFTLCTTARQHFLRGEYLEAFTVLLEKDTWAQLSLTQFGYWSEQVWWLMWDVATRRGQEAFKLQFLEPRKPPTSPFDAGEKGKKSPETIRKMILEAAEALTARNVTRATLLIIDALHYAEVNGYWHLYRSAIPIFADLELQRGKIQSARKRIEAILPQVARGEDLEQRAMTYAIYAKVKMAQSQSIDKELLSEALGYLKMAEDDYRKLEMPASIQDMLYLQAVVHEAAGEAMLRDSASKSLREVEEVEEKLSIGLDEPMIAVWDVVCEIGVAVAHGDTYCP
ncbi:hypothetical protein FRC17_003254 [Serendipita sp. 399]|nr:hypothetical protein FRC17_003254 [Serendipita sp. 399]